MKPGIVDRLLLIAVMLALFALGLAFIGMALYIVKPDMVSAAAALPYASAANGWITAGIGLLLAIIAAVLAVDFNRRAPRAKGPAVALISQGEMGTSSITLAAVDDMVRRHCAQNGNIKKCESAVAVNSNRLMISLKLVLDEQAKVPETASALRASLADYIQDITGIEVADVSILVALEPEKLKAS